MTCSKVLRRDLTNFSCLTKLGRKRGIVFFLDQIRNSKVPNSSLKKENTNCADFITLILKGVPRNSEFEVHEESHPSKAILTKLLFYLQQFFHYDFKLKRDPLFNQLFLFLFQFPAADPWTKFVFVLPMISEWRGTIMVILGLSPHHFKGVSPQIDIRRWTSITWTIHPNK